MIITCNTCGAHNRVPASRLRDNGRCAKCKASISPLTKPVELDSLDAFRELIEHSPLPVVVDFWAAWCAPCRTVAPELVKVASLKSGAAVVAKVNTEQLPDIAQKYRIESIPTLVRFDGGRESQRLSGARPAGAIITALGLP